MKSSNFKSKKYITFFIDKMYTTLGKAVDVLKCNNDVTILVLQQLCFLVL